LVLLRDESCGVFVRFRAPLLGQYHRRICAEQTIPHRDWTVWTVHQEIAYQARHSGGTGWVMFTARDRGARVGQARCVESAECL
jgi:hypothetical protein